MAEIAKRILIFLALVLSVFSFLSCGDGDGGFSDGRLENPGDNAEFPEGGSSDDDEPDDDPGSGPGQASDDDDNDDDASDDDAVDDDDDNDDNDDDDSLDPEGDEDKDGISNGRELEDGTDPLDPSDALQWQPDYSGHPKLIADRDRWVQIRDHIRLSAPDAVRLFSRIQAMADREIRLQEPGNYLFSYNEYNGETALNAAAVAFVNEDATYAAKAIELVSTFEVNLTEITYNEFDHGTIHGGQALVEYCLAYDLLVGFDLIDASQAQEMRARILTFASKLYHLYIVLPTLQFIPNNHLIKFASGLGVTGMTFNDIPEAAVYVNLAMTSAPYILLDFQMPDEGGQGEGPNYLDYTFKTWLYLSAIYHRFAGGETYPYRIDCRTRLLPGCAGEVIDVPDPAIDEPMARLLDWRMALVMPDGHCPPIDDSNLSCGYSGPIAALYERADYAWHYRASRDCKENTYSLAVLELAFWDRMPEPSVPDFGPSLLMPEGGQAILRSGWGEDAAYGLIVGEHGKARLAGIGHEQPDATSFIFYAMGQMLAIDSGYINYDERWRVIHPENHNLILVDGQGPSLGLYWIFADADAYLSEFIDQPPFRSAKVNASYRQATIERRVMLIDDDYFITQETASSDRVRRYAWLLQANAGGSTDGVFTLEPTGALIECPGGVMETFLQSAPGPIALSEGEEEHGYHYGRIDTHAVLRGEVDSQTARFLGVHLLAETTDDLSRVDTLSAEGLLGYAVDSGDCKDLILSSGQEEFLLPAAGGLPAVESDGDVVWIRFDPSGETVWESRRIGGTYLRIDGVIRQ